MVWNSLSPALHNYSSSLNTFGRRWKTDLFRQWGTFRTVLLQHFCIPGTINKFPDLLTYLDNFTLLVWCGSFPVLHIRLATCLIVFLLCSCWPGAVVWKTATTPSYISVQIKAMWSLRVLPMAGASGISLTVSSRCRKILVVHVVGLCLVFDS